MKTSIAMTTYNGIKYIKELLDSLLSQTLKPDEVIIVDDKSTDGTPQYISNYIEVHGLRNWIVYTNKNNVGWRKNFRIALSYCSNELVFLCDQDDIWKPDKIKEMHDIMCEHGEIQLLASNYEILNEGSDEDVRIIGSDNNGGLKRIHFGYGSLSVLRPGCTYCVRLPLVREALENDLPTSPHDAILWGWASIYDGLYIYEKETIIYRRHKECASLSSDPRGIEKRISDIKYNIGMEEHFVQVCQRRGMEKEAKCLQNHVSFYEKRLGFFERKKRICICFFAITHASMYPTKRNMLSDIVLSLKL